MTNISLNEIRKKGLEVLLKALGPEGTLKFFEQFDLGSGDYTTERKKWLKDKDIDSIIKEIEEQKRK